MEFELNGFTYKVGRIDARQQFHIVRRLAPVIGKIIPSVQGGTGGHEQAFTSMAEAIAGLSDSDADYCIFGLLKAISRKQDKGLGWGAICVGESLQYNDITMPDMLQLAWKSLSFNLSSFFAALPSDLQERFQKANAL